MSDAREMALKQYAEALDNDPRMTHWEVAHDIRIMAEMSDRASADDWRTELDLCPRGEGHWWGWCEHGEDKTNE